VLELNSSSALPQDHVIAATGQWLAAALLGEGSVTGEA